MASLQTLNNKLLIQRTKLVKSEEDGYCCCPDLSACPEGYYSNGPMFTWFWSTVWNAWFLCEEFTMCFEQEMAGLAECENFLNENGFLGAGPMSPTFAGAFDGDQTTSGCICGS